MTDEVKCPHCGYECNIGGLIGANTNDCPKCGKPVLGVNMKHFAVEVKRTSYVTIHVEADTKEQAEELAWAEIESGESYGISDDANWEVEDIYEQFATDESRSYGPHGATA